MQTIQDLVQELIFTKSIKSLVSSKEEISIMRMRKIRDFVLEARDFTVGLARITGDIRRTYWAQFHSITSTGSVEELIKFSVSIKTGAWVCVLVTPNSRLAGSIVTKVYSLFEESIKKNSFADIVIIGALGKQLFDQSKLNRHYTYFEVPESVVDQKDLESAITFLSGYAKIDVYYGKLHSLVNQEAVKTDITAEKLFQADLQSQETEESHLDKFLFEPELRLIIQAMEVQFLALFFKQIIDESTLAQLGSRISFMQEASDKIEQKIKQLDYVQKIAEKIKYNKKMQQTYAGLSLWM